MLWDITFVSFYKSQLLKLLTMSSNAIVWNNPFTTAFAKSDFVLFDKVYFVTSKSILVNILDSNTTTTINVILVNSIELLWFNWGEGKGITEGKFHEVIYRDIKFSGQKNLWYCNVRALCYAVGIQIIYLSFCVCDAGTYMYM